jgi:hypothetical protein
LKSSNVKPAQADNSCTVWQFSHDMSLMGKQNVILK